MNITPRDVLSTPNAITATGLVMAVHGAQHLDTPRGLAEMGVGRMFDLADGYVARRTGQTSELGAALDASSDKIAAAAIVLHEWRLGVAPKPVLAAIVAQNLANTAITALHAHRRPDQLPTSSRDGKYATAAQNLALGAYALSHNVAKTNHTTLSDALRYVGHAAAFIGVGCYGLRATKGYWQRLRQS